MFRGLFRYVNETSCALQRSLTMDSTEALAAGKKAAAIAAVDDHVKVGLLNNRPLTPAHSTLINAHYL